MNLVAFILTALLMVSQDAPARSPAPAGAQAKQPQVEILGAVAKPGKYPYSDGMTVQRVLELAGGILDITDQSPTRLYQIVRTVDGKPVSISAALDTPLKAGDRLGVIVIVTRTASHNSG